MNANTSRKFAAGSVVAVAVPVAIAEPYDYLVGTDSVGEGSIVRVPLGGRTVWGVVWGEATSGLERSRLKAILEVSDAPPLSPETRAFIDWVAAYTLSPRGMVMKMTIPLADALDVQKEQSVVKPVESAQASARMTDGRRRVLSTASTLPPLTVADLAREAGVGSAVVRQMIDLGMLAQEQTKRPARFHPPRFDGPSPLLSNDQSVAAEDLCQALETGFSVTVVDGVTGSGKTEVYLEAVAQCVKNHRQALVLLPEISLSSQWLDRFQNRFGVAPAVWHSDLTPAQRRDAWRGIVHGDASVVVGARSALFLPFPDLGLIVVDEEHDGSYKQEEGVCYHARDMAVVRGKIENIPVVLASATPSLETLVNVQSGKYRVRHLPDRHGDAQMPDIAVIDLRSQPPARGRWLSPPLVEALTGTLAAGEQAMLFLNRRGYAPLTLCRSCGHRLQCPDCQAWLVEHRARRQMVCHHCGFWIPPPSVCPQCGQTDCFAACGPGIERIAEEMALLFPDARLGVMASDMIASPLQADRLVKDMTERRIDVLIGTQIVAKGHHFPLLTLVGVVDADMGMEGGDLRAGERTWQLLSQVAGRAGRARHPGRVMLQTWYPEHPVIQALARSDRDGFLTSERQSRLAAGMPPFGRLAAVIVSGKDAEAVDRFCRAMAQSSPIHQKVDVWGPTPAPMAYLRGRHRRRFLVKAPRSFAIQAFLKEWLVRIRPKNDIRLQIDVDPYSFS